MPTDAKIQRKLNKCRRNNTKVKLYLTSGKSFSGFIEAFDKFTIILKTAANKKQLFFKHAVSTLEAE